MDNHLYTIEELIELLEDLLGDATRVPFGKKSMVDIDRMSEIIGEMRITLPEEIEQAQKVVMDKNNIIAEAKREAENIIRNAEQRRAALLDGNDIIKEARRRATEMVNAEQNRCTDIRASTNAFVDDMLKRVEELLSYDLNKVQVLRANVNGMKNSIQSPQPALRPIDKPGE